MEEVHSEEIGQLPMRKRGSVMQISCSVMTCHRLLCFLPRDIVSLHGECQKFVNKYTLLIAIVMCGGHHLLFNRFFQKILMRLRLCVFCVFSQVLMVKILSPVLCSSFPCEAGEQNKRIVSPVETDVFSSGWFLSRIS